MGKIVLKSNDGRTFEVEEIVALESRTIKMVIEEFCDNSAIPLPLIKGETLAKIVEYCKHHADIENSSEEELKKFDDEFLLNLDQKMLNALFCAADYLGINNLFNLIRAKVDPDEILRMCETIEGFQNSEEQFLRLLGDMNLL